MWRPGQRTPIHSHASWCVVGVHEGCEQERSFRLAGGRAVETDRRTMLVGDVAALDAGDDDIHEVRNAGDGVTISLHVYGLDYRAAGIQHPADVRRATTSPPGRDGLTARSTPSIVRESEVLAGCNGRTAATVRFGWRSKGDMSMHVQRPRCLHAGRDDDSDATPTRHREGES